ncbi:MAG TPA: hypothetical protein VF142_04270 [Longimicrobium sp.]
MQDDSRRRMRLVMILVGVVLVLAGVLLARLMFAFTGSERGTFRA